MKYLEAKRLAEQGGDGGENKMQTGTRSDQRSAIRKGQLQPENRPTAKPEVRDLAKSLGVDLASIEGTGRNGEVTLKDVRDAKSASGQQGIGEQDETK